MGTEYCSICQCCGGGVMLKADEGCDTVPVCTKCLEDLRAQLAKCKEQLSCEVAQTLRCNQRAFIAEHNVTNLKDQLAAEKAARERAVVVPIELLEKWSEPRRYKDCDGDTFCRWCGGMNGRHFNSCPHIFVFEALAKRREGGVMPNYIVETCPDCGGEIARGYPGDMRRVDGCTCQPSPTVILPINDLTDEEMEQIRAFIESEEGQAKILAAMERANARSKEFNESMRVKPTVTLPRKLWEAAQKVVEAANELELLGGNALHKVVISGSRYMKLLDVRIDYDKAFAAVEAELLKEN